mgnify:CR=1 FL=1
MRDKVNIALLIVGLTLIVVCVQNQYKIKKLEKTIDKICDLGKEMTLGLINNQKSIIQAFSEIDKLKKGRNIY